MEEKRALIEPEHPTISLARQCELVGLARSSPEIFNNDQGSQFTSMDFTGRLQAAGVRISWDGRGRALDNIFVERLWRSVKYEEVYLKDYRSVSDAERGLKA